MKEFKVKVIDPIGLHARPASVIAQEASKYQSKIEIKLDSKTANAKSIINMMALGVKSGNEISFIIDGPDADMAEKSLKKLLKDQNII